MSALAELFDILYDRVPPKYILPVDEIVEVLRQHINRPMSDDDFHYYQVGSGDAQPRMIYDEEDDESYPEDLHEPEGFLNHVSEVAQALAPYYTPQFKRGTYNLDDWGDEVHEFLTNSWNALYNDLHRQGGARANQRRRERETHKQREARIREERDRAWAERIAAREAARAAAGGSSPAVRRMR